MNAPAMTEEGTFEHRGHQVWWGRAGAELSGAAAPLLTVHGGPGICHDCLEPLAALAVDRPVLFYDQYGCGRSDRAVEPDEYDIDLFVDEIAAMRDALNVHQVHLYAHSYGGPLALEYLFRKRPEGVLSLTLSNTFPSMPALVEGWRRRLAELPIEHCRALQSAPEWDPAAYGAALEDFWHRFVLPFPAPDALARSQEHSGPEVYQRMHGSSWFTPDGVWSTWDARAKLHELELPTLVIGGTQDQCVPELALEIADGISGSELAVLEAAHLPFFEVREDYLKLLGGFLARVDRSRT